MARNFFPLVTATALAIESISKHGFQRSRDDEPTKAHVEYLLLEGFEPEEATVLRARAIIEWVRELEVKSDFDDKLADVFYDDSVSPRGLAFVAAAVPAFERASERKTQRESAVFIGEAGDRAKALGRFEVIGLREGEGQYGPWLLVKARRMSDGAVASWFATGGFAPFGEGDVIDVRGGVKGHNRQYGETSLTRARAKIVPAIMPDDDEAF